MYPTDDLDAAVRAGILPEQTAQSLRNFAAERRGTPAASEERVNLVVGVAEVMTTIGLVAATVPIAVICYGAFGAYGGGLVSILAWIGARYLVLRRKLVLPSFYIFALIIIAAFLFIWPVSMMAAGEKPYSGALSQSFVAVPPVANLVVAITLATVAFAYWHKFRLPLAWAFGAMTTLNVGLHVLRILVPGASQTLVAAFMLFAGFCFLALAIWWDMSDIRRETVRAQVAFWLHLIAGHEIVMRSYQLIMGVGERAEGWSRAYAWSTRVPTPSEAVIALAAFATFSIVALILDRRSLIMSSLFFIVPAAAAVAPVPIAVFGLGATLLFLSLGWTPLRRGLLHRMPRILAAQVPRTTIKHFYERPVA